VGTRPRGGDATEGRGHTAEGRRHRVQRRRRCGVVGIGSPRAGAVGRATGGRPTVAVWEADGRDAWARPPLVAGECPAAQRARRQRASGAAVRPLWRRRQRPTGPTRGPCVCGRGAGPRGQGRRAGMPVRGAPPRAPTQPASRCSRDTSGCNGSRFPHFAATTAQGVASSMRVTCGDNNDG